MYMAYTRCYDWVGVTNKYYAYNITYSPGCGRNSNWVVCPNRLPCQRFNVNNRYWPECKWNQDKCWLQVFCNSLLLHVCIIFVCVFNSFTQLLWWLTMLLPVTAGRVNSFIVLSADRTHGFTIIAVATFGKVRIPKFKMFLRLFTYIEFTFYIC